MSIKDNFLWALSFGTRVPPKANKPEVANVEAEKLALRLLKSRARYKALKNGMVNNFDAMQERLNTMSLYLISLVAMNKGVVVIQKDMLDSLSEKVSTLAINVKKLEDTPGDIELKILDLSKEIEEAKEVANEK